MNRFEAWSTHLATILVGGTGLVYAWMRYALQSSDPYAVIHHPWEPTVQHLHVLTAPLLVFAVGVIWRRHVWKHYREGVPAKRRSGLTLLATVAPMIASGYLLQTAVDSTWRRIWLILHLAASTLWLLGYAAHHLAALRLSRRSHPAPPSEPIATSR